MRNLDYDVHNDSLNLKYADFLEKVQNNNLLIRNSKGNIINKDGCLYFDDVDELIFNEATEESKEKARKEIKQNMKKIKADD